MRRHYSRDDSLNRSSLGVFSHVHDALRLAMCLCDPQLAVEDGDAVVQATGNTLNA
jgi:hypothetical protein